MNRLFVGCLIGLGIGLSLSSFFKNPSTENTAKDEGPYQGSVQGSVVAFEAPKKQIPKVLPTQSPVKKAEVLTVEQKTDAGTRHISLELSSEQVATLEANLRDLQKDVSLYREQAGWSVRFHHPTNIMSMFGFKDSDLIRFSSLQAMKQDPSKQELISRLEQVLSQLER